MCFQKFLVGTIHELCLRHFNIQKALRSFRDYLSKAAGNSTPLAGWSFSESKPKIVGCVKAGRNAPENMVRYG